ncbi:amino acid adenylation domain-containing protein [Tenacibaculum sp. 190524A02b]|uniref:amino acid adenylation domain-containing protein n=1 Tax=Tenacibaculum vairaonense TaxID=3137860 RepID=UPI0031FADFA4
MTIFKNKKGNIQLPLLLNLKEEKTNLKELSINKALIYEKCIKSEVRKIKIDSLVNIEKKVQSEINTNQQRSISWPSNSPLSLVKGEELIMPSDHVFKLESLLDKAANTSDSKGVYFVNGENEECFISYRMLYTKAQQRAFSLKNKGVQKEDIIIMQYHENDEFLITFWALIFIEAIPTPMGVLKDLRIESSDVKRLKNVSELLGFPKILCDDLQEEKLKNVLQVWDELFEEDYKNPVVINTDSLKNEGILEPNYKIDSDSITLHLLTSGTTGKPKCVQHSHRTLCNHVVINSKGFELEEDSVHLNWMPLDHVGGIVMSHLQALYKQCVQVQINVNLFGAQPLRWLDWIEKYKITHTWSPNFSFNIITQHINNQKERNWDLSSLKSILNAGEQVTSVVCHDFLKALAKFGLKDSVMQPGWGMSETSSVMTINDKITAFETKSGIQGIVGFTEEGVAIPSEENSINKQLLVEIGRPLPGISIRIVNDELEVVPQGVKGKLQISSPTLMRGYRNNEKANKESFIGDGWMDTGDIAFMVDDRLTISGREKDMIIINGINYACYDIEEICESVFGVEENWSVACSIPNAEDGSDILAIFFVCSGTEPTFMSGVITQIKEKITTQLGINPDLIIPIEKKDIPKTNIGKKQRAAVIKSYLDNKFIEGESFYQTNNNSKNTILNWFSHIDWKEKELATNTTKSQLLIWSKSPNWDTVQEVKVFEKWENLIAELNNSNKRKSIIIDFTNMEENLELQFLEIIKAFDTVKSVIDKILVITKNLIPYSQKNRISKTSGVSGLIKTLPHEFEHIKLTTQLDVDVFNEKLIHKAIKEAFNEKENSLVLIRDDKRYEFGLKRSKAVEDVGLINKELPLDKEGLYLITGGLGGVGFRLAQFLIEELNAKVIISGRKAKETLKGEALDKWNTLQGLTSNVYYTNVNIASFEELEEEIKNIETKYNQSLKGIFHFAGIIQEILLKDLTKSQLEEMYLAKVIGTKSLSKLLNSRNECILVTTSSARAIKSGMTVGTYAAASDFVENYTTKLYEEGKKAYCFSWSLWDGVGMGKDLAIKQVLASRGYLSMPIEKAFASMLIGLKLSQPVTYVGLDSSAKEIASLTQEITQEKEIKTLLFTTDDNNLEITKVLKEFREEDKSSSLHVLRVTQIPYKENGEVDTERIESLLLAKQKQFQAPESITEQQLSEIWKSILNVDSVSKTDNFFSLGGDSLKATRLITKIKEEFNTIVKIEQLFELAELQSLAKLIDTNSEESNQLKIEVKEKRSYPCKLPMSLAQKRQWFTYMYAPESPLYVNAFSLIFNGKLNIEILKSSLNAIVERHEGLRTNFNIDSESNLWQIIKEPYVVDLDVIDVSLLPIQEQEYKINKLRNKESNKVFFLEEDTMLRCKLIKLSEEKNELLFSIHHIVSDGWSAGVFVRDLQALYTAKASNLNIELPELAFQPADFGIWQENNCNIGTYDESIAYWKNQLSDKPKVLDFPFDYIRPASQTYNGTAQILSLDTNLSRRLKEFSEEKGCTLYMTMMSAFAILIKQYARQEEVVLGSLIANRQNATIEKLIGFFVNTLAISFDMSKSLSFEEFLQQTKQVILNAWKHQDVPFDRLIDELEVEREASMHPLFQFLFVQQNAHEQKVDLGELDAEFIIHDQEATRFDLECHIFDREAYVDVKIIYNTDLFNPETINQFLHQYETILNSVISSPNLSINEQRVLPKTQEHTILNVWNKEINFKTKEATVQELWYKQVEERGDAIALKGLKRVYSYQWVDTFTNTIASIIQNKGIKSKTPIGLLFDREDELYLSILATVKLGAVYVPIDPSYPEERIKWIIEDTKTPIILCSSHLEGEAKKYGDNILIVDTDFNYQQESANLSNTINNTEDPIYINYTSGSTGKPKGVVVPQRGVLRTVVDNEYYDIDESDVFLQLGNPTFDTFTLEIWGAWLYGGKLVVIKKNDILDIGKLANVIEKEQVTGGFMTVTLFNSLIEYKPEAIKSYKCLLVGGEAISVSHIKKALNYLPKGLMNGYGPTENSVFTTTYPISNVKERQPSIPIGYPLRDSRVYILNENKELVPPGVPGIIYGAGKGVALSYLNNPEITQEKFIDDTFVGQGLMYNTGDVGRWLPDGSIEYLGRLDKQVKIRGHRIECGEIEARINEYLEVKDSVVEVFVDKTGNKKLAAWIVFNNEDKISELESYLSEELPGYMIPSYYTVIHEIPLNSNGKVDRKQLPEPELNTINNEELVQPETKKQLILSEVWKEVLGLNNVSIKSEFFSLGGDSIVVVQMISKLMIKGYQIKPKQVFQLKTIEKLAEVMVPLTKKNLKDQEQLKGNVSLSPIQEWFFNFNKEEVNYWNLPVLVSLKTKPSKEDLQTALDKLAMHHDMLRAKYEKNITGNWEQIISENVNPITIDFIDLTNEKNQENKLLKHAEEVQKTLNIEEGALCKAIVYEVNKNDIKLFLCMHHLVVDGISWRILIEDLFLLLENPQVKLPPKTSSFKSWQETLNIYKNEQLKDQKDYWKSIQERIENQKLLPEIDFSKKDREGDAFEEIVSLTSEETSSLINEVNQVYKTAYNDILLTALSKAVHELTSIEDIIVTLEGHGREDINDAIDISRTVGWFTTAYPSSIVHNHEASLKEQILNIKDTLRSIPEKGLGYGLLDKKEEVKSQLCFNYLGRLDQSEESFELAPKATGKFHAPRAVRPYPIELNCWVNDAIFTVKVTTPGYTTKYKSLGELFIKNLKIIINHCLTTNEFSYQTVDFDSVQLSEKELNLLPSGIKDVYPLTKNQEGMLYQHINYPKAKVYFTQVKQELKGNVNRNILQKAIEQVVNNYDNLRTQFIWESFRVPVQLVHNNVSVDLKYTNLTANNDKQKDLEEFFNNDLDNPFNLAQLTTPRFNLIELQEEQSLLVLSFHHIILDGWSLFLVLNAIIDTYHNLSNNNTYKLKTNFKSSFKDFILNHNNTSINETFWQKYLRGIEPIPELSPELREKGLMEKIQQESVTINTHKTTQLKKVAQLNGITLNTILQTAWTLTLAQFNGVKDVLYATTFSGRLPAIEDVDQVSGMLINSLPLRVNLHNQYETILELSKRIQNTVLELHDYQLVELNETYKAAKLDVSKRYFDSILVFENYANDSNTDHSLIQMGETTAYEHTNFPLSLVIMPEEEILIRLSYQNHIYSEGKIVRLLNQLETVLNQMVDNINDSVLQSLYVNQNEVDFKIDSKNIRIHTLYEDQDEVYRVLNQEEGSQIFILNESLEEIKNTEQIGEIYLSINNPIESCGDWGEWMDENKIENPIFKDSYLYPTGDTGKWNKDSTIQILELEEY